MIHIHMSDQFNSSLGKCVEITEWMSEQTENSGI